MESQEEYLLTDSDAKPEKKSIRIRLSTAEARFNFRFSKSGASEQELSEGATLPERSFASMSRKSFAVRRLSRMSYRPVVDQPGDATRAKGPTSMSEQMQEINEESYVIKLAEMESVDKVRKQQMKKIYHEKEGVRLSVIQSSSPPEQRSDKKMKRRSRVKKKSTTTKSEDTRRKSASRSIIDGTMFVPRHTILMANQVYREDHRQMMKVTKCLGLPNPVAMPSVTHTILRKDVKELTLREMAKLADMAQPNETQLAKFYVTWAAGLDDDSDISFFMETVDLYGRHLRYEVANLYDFEPHDLVIRQTRGYRKKDGALVVMTVSCAFADQWGNIVIHGDVERIRSCVINDRDRVPMPGEWRALIQVLSSRRLRLRKQERKRVIAMYELAKCIGMDTKMGFFS